MIKEFDFWLQYELPKNLIGKIWKGKYRGQKQKWFLVKFLGEEKEININTINAEFIEWQWINVENLPGVIVEFKRKVYEDLLPKIKASIN